MKTYVKSSPHFFRPVKTALLSATALLLGLAFLIPAPLQEPATLASAPNPVKSAWFLLWIQELISYKLWLIYPVILSAVLFAALPWLIGRQPDRATWFGPGLRLQALLVMIAFIGIVTLTIIGLFFRGENWSLIWPF